jgi:D-alanyl-D-alanine carboxypeptidase
MTAGLVDYSQVPAFQKEFLNDLGQQWTPDQLIGFGISQKPLFAPGTAFGYSNTNTLLLGKVIEKVTGQSIADNYQQRILGPLSLASTTYPNNTDIPNPHPAPFQLNPQTGQFEQLPVVNLSALGAAGGLVSTLDDLHRWGQALGSGELIGADLQKRREADTMPADHPKYDRYGLGIGQLDGWWGHTGEGLGYQAAVFRRPSDGAVIVVLLNSTQETNVATAIFQSLAAALPAP